MRLSFTGSSHVGWTQHQRDRVLEVLEQYRPTCIHGACIYCDDQFDALAHSLGLPRVVFPSNHPTKSALTACLNRGGNIIVACHPMPPLKRNPLIVKAGDRLISTPKENRGIIRSGTWATTRLAIRKLGRDRVEIIYP